MVMQRKNEIVPNSDILYVFRYNTLRDSGIRPASGTVKPPQAFFLAPFSAPRDTPVKFLHTGHYLCVLDSASTEQVDDVQSSKPRHICGNGMGFS